MNDILTKEVKQLLEINYMPAVSIILPFNPKMSSPSEIQYELRIILGKIKKQLMSEYPSEKAVPVINKLNQLVGGLNYHTHKKSIAIFVSTFMEKVFYLDLPVTEKTVIGEKFEIRDLILSQKENIQYLILMLNSKSSRTYLGNYISFTLIKSNVREYFQTYERDLPEMTAHFSDIHEQREILLENFMHHMDEGLSIILKAYPYPVFVMGVERVLGHFKKVTRNDKNILRYIHGNFEEGGETRIRSVMKPYLTDWENIKEEIILQKIERAKNANKLVSGIKNAWFAAIHKNGQLLIVEKAFTYPAYLAGSPAKIQTVDDTSKRPFYIKDAIDDIIVKVLESGGDVEFVNNDLLISYGRIALIKYY
jgi:Bacterial archaeo-eukaryotic release factor family 3